MKSLITLIAVLLLSFNSEAYEQHNSELHLSDYQRNNILVSINGTWLSPSTIVRFDHLQEGSHHLIVQKKKMKFHPYGGMYESFEQVFKGDIIIPRDTKVIAEIGPYGNFRVLETIHLHPEPICFTPQIMHPESFNNLLYVMEEESFDKDKLEVAQHAVRNNSMNANQLRIIMNKLTFESNKLKLAKYAYPFIVDPGNIYQVYPSFDFSSSKRRLMSYIHQNY